MPTKLLQQKIKNGLSYLQYRKLVKDLLQGGKSTGLEQTEERFNFSKLNDKRMDRLDKTLNLTDEAKNFTASLSKKFTFLVIAEGWCGDAAQVLPIINLIAEASDNFDLKIVLRDENEDLMRQFLTNGSKAIPKIIIVDDAYNLINSWGPRPYIATKMVQDYKAKNGVVDAIIKKDLQLWYNKDKGISTQSDLVNLLKAS